MSRRGPIARALIGAACAVAASCGSLDPPPSSSVPINDCSQTSCAAYAEPSELAAPSCSGGRCLSDTPIDFTLVVSLPESSFTDPGATIAIPRFESSYVPSLTHTSACPADTGCAQIPLALQPQGWFIVAGSVQGNAGRPVDKPTPSTTGAALLVEVQFRPLVTQGSSSTVSAEALAVGLPLTPIAARAATSPGGLANGFTGPLGTPATQWSALVAPGLYEQDVVPQDDAYPPVRSVQPVTGAFQNTQINGVDVEVQTGASTFTVTRVDGSLAGFAVYLRDAATLRRVSSRATLGAGGSASVKLLTSGEQPYAGGQHKLQLVVAPPDGAPIPFLADPVLQDKLGPSEQFPPLPPYLLVSGTVRAADQSPIEADLVIDSTTPSAGTGGIFTCTAGGCPSLTPLNPAQPHMFYSTTTHAGPDGTYAVALPPGTYDVFIVPAAGAAAGASSVTLTLQPAHAGLPPTAAGKDLATAPLATIQGVATVADGRALTGATVEAHAAASLGATLDPRRWPRTASTVTDGAGKFALSVDPGTYDVVVRPADGTGFPWVTLSSQPVSAGGVLALPTIKVPAPIAVDLVLHDQGDNPIVYGVVRAFAAPASAVSPSPGVPPPQVELGTWLTDASGHLTMYLAPPQ